MAFLMHGSKEWILGFMWVGIGTLIMLYFYTLYFVYKPKVMIEDKAEFKQVYVYMEKNARPMAILLLMYLVPSFVIINEFPEDCLRLLGKGALLCAIVGPLMDYHYGDKRRYRFSVR